MVKTAVLYVREMSGSAIQEQLDVCRRHAEAQGLVPVAAVIDLQTPGPAYRLGLRGVLDMVGAGDVPVVIAVSPTHLSKDPVRLQALQETLEEKSCEIQFAEEQD